MIFKFWRLTIYRIWVDKFWQLKKILMARFF